MDKRCACLLLTNIVSLPEELVDVGWMYAEQRSFLIHPGSRLKSHFSVSQVNCYLSPVLSSFAITQYSICGVLVMLSICVVSVPPACANTSDMSCGNNVSSFAWRNWKSVLKRVGRREKRKASPQMVPFRRWKKGARGLAHIHSVALGQPNSMAPFLHSVRLDISMNLMN